MQATTLQNWAGNYTYSTQRLHRPDSVRAVQQLVKTLPQLRVLGTRHCFNAIADSTENLVSLALMNQVTTLNRDARTVTIGGGINYGQLCPYLHENGFALHNLASLPHIAVAGACATATHGSGSNNGNLATAVAALEIVTAAGDVITLSRDKDGPQFYGAVVSLGCMGVITQLTLDIVPAYSIQQNLYEHLPFTQLENRLQTIFSSAYSVSLFTDWKSRSFNQVWLKHRIENGTLPEVPDNFYGAVAATKALHPIGQLSAIHCTEQLGVPGPWHERLPHFRMNFTPSSGEELQSEYFVPLNSGYEALLAIDQVREHIAPHLLISEIRTIAADDYWLSPCHHQPCLAIHFTWQQNLAAVQQVLPLIEAQLAPFNARPHWGKLFTMAPEQIARLYKQLPAFRQLLQQYDPQGKFRNGFIDKYIFSQK